MCLELLIVIFIIKLQIGFLHIKESLSTLLLPGWLQDGGLGVVALSDGGFGVEALSDGVLGGEASSDGGFCVVALLDGGFGVVTSSSPSFCSLSSINLHGAGEAASVVGIAVGRGVGSKIIHRHFLWWLYHM